jgi:cyclopropane-fatty-acyl-phospholipid synthase
MNTDRLKADLEKLLLPAGISINGSHPWDLRVINEQFYSKVLTLGSRGAGEAYVDGWWDCERLDEFFSRILRVNIEKGLKENWKILLDVVWTKISNRQTPGQAVKNGHRHYDLGNDLFIQMLDKRMIYTSAYWKDAATLDKAQEHKLDLTCRKLNLKPGMHILDIGCGWGGFAKYAAENYMVRVTGITVSKEQAELGNVLCKGLPVEIRLMDYRDLREKYDCIVSLGMFEHVGYKNYRTFMNKASNCLHDNGLLLLHTIGGNTSVTSIDPWLNTYIFPGAMLPSIKQIGRAIEGLFVMEDWHNFSADYDRTLMAWHDNFISNWEKLKSHYDESFFRMWRYYLLMCAGSFRARKNQLWQIVLSKNGIPGGYISVR